MFCQFSAIRRQGCRRKSELHHGWCIEDGCVHKQFLIQNILEALRFGTLNKKNVICRICRDSLPKAPFAPNTRNIRRKGRDFMSIYDTLNEQQKLGVTTTEGPVLILAGAGSGKTRVLTHRTAYLIEEKGINPYHIMAITFTNKAAGEMRERIDAMVGYGSESIWVSTFHSTCVRILRRHIDRIGYDTNFTIYDADDSKSVMKEICKRLNIDTKIYKERKPSRSDLLGEGRAGLPG